MDDKPIKPPKQHTFVAPDAASVVALVIGVAGHYSVHTAISVDLVQVEGVLSPTRRLVRSSARKVARSRTVKRVVHVVTAPAPVPPVSSTLVVVIFYSFWPRKIVDTHGRSWKRTRILMGRTHSFRRTMDNTDVVSLVGRPQRGRCKSKNTSTHHCARVVHVPPGASEQRMVCPTDVKINTHLQDHAGRSSFDSLRFDSTVSVINGSFSSRFLLYCVYSRPLGMRFFNSKHHPKSRDVCSEQRCSFRSHNLEPGEILRGYQPNHQVAAAVWPIQ